MGRSNAVSTVEEKYKWLAAHPEFINAKRNVIVSAMKKAGLIAPSTYALDVTMPTNWNKPNLRSGKVGA